MPLCHLLFKKNLFDDLWLLQTNKGSEKQIHKYTGGMKNNARLSRGCKDYLILLCFMLCYIC